MKHIKFIIPNALTLLNLLGGSIATVLIFEGLIKTGIYLLLISAVADVLDGLTAKLLKATSEFGKQLDSLADLVSFGLAPSVLLYKMVYSALTANNSAFSINTAAMGELILLFAVFSVALFAALRLARFNLDTSSGPDFKGLPVPANALIVIAVWISANYSASLISLAVAKNAYTLVLIAGFLSFLMISNLPMLSFKFKNLKVGENIWKYLLITGSVLLFVVFGATNLIFIMIYYIVLSLVKLTVSKIKKRS
jgi:CDP-diacylglycerol---serine O-phosphatidyltransferase